MSIPIIGAGGPSDRTSIKLVTRRGNWINNEQRDELPPSAIKAGLDLISTTHPDAQFRSSPTNYYNCMGLPFASRRTCIDTDQLALIFTDDGYRQLASTETPQVGDIVVYKWNSGSVGHIGVIVRIEIEVDPARLSRTIWVMSKWGYGGEYIHRINDVPEVHGTPTEFWTDRR